MKFVAIRLKGRKKLFTSHNSLYMKYIDHRSDEVEVVFLEKSELTKRWKNRLERFAPNGIPKHINVYDNGGESVDRYTCCFKGLKLKFFPYLCMSEYPFSPQGVGIHGDHSERIDYPKYSHLGKKIKWNVLPHDVKCCIWQDYCDYWDIPTPVEYLYGYKGDK